MKEDKLPTAYVWTVEHDKITLRRLTYEPRKEYSGTVVFLPRLVGVGYIVQDEHVLTCHQFTKDVYNNVKGHPDFKDAALVQEDGSEFVCNGNVIELMETIQHTVEFNHEIREKLTWIQEIKRWFGGKAPELK